MKFWVGVTDNDWFRFLAEQSPDEVNFWRPSAKQSFRAIEPGAPFLFKLHSPLNYIVGGGFLVSYSVLPLSLAWDAFGEKNGSPDFPTFRAQIQKYRERKGPMELNPLIGCAILTSPLFLPECEWLAVPSDWAPNVVQGRSYDTHDEAGRTLWEKFQEKILKQESTLTDDSSLVASETVRYGAEYLARARLGQGAFRVLVTDAYNRRCAITGERTLPVLQAAHIKPYSKTGPNRVHNRLLLRSDLHILFDHGFLTITPDHQVEVSQRIKEEYENGRDYYALHGKELVHVPSRAIDRPLPDLLKWHNENVYVP